MSLVKLVPVGRCCKRPCFLSRESVVGTQACIRLSCYGLCRVRLLVPTASHVRGILGVPQRKTTPSASIRLRFFLSDLIDLHLFSRLASLTSTRLLCQTQHTQTPSSCPGSRGEAAAPLRGVRRQLWPVVRGLPHPGADAFASSFRRSYP